MTFDELKAELEKIQNGPKLLEGVLELINAEKQIGISEKNKSNSEAQKLRKFKKALEAVGYTDADDLDEFTSNLVDLKTKKTTENEGGSLTMKSLQEQIKGLTKSLETERQRVINAEKEAKTKTLSAKLTQSLSDKVYGADLLVKSLINDGQVDLDGEQIVFKNNGESIPYEQGLNTLLETRKDIVKGTQKGGTGSPQKNTTPSNISSILQSNDPEAIKANFKEIAGAIGLKL